jgi:hypothetical protein
VLCQLVNPLASHRENHLISHRASHPVSLLVIRQGNQRFSLRVNHPVTRHHIQVDNRPINHPESLRVNLLLNHQEFHLSFPPSARLVNHPLSRPLPHLLIQQVSPLVIQALIHLEIPLANHQLLQRTILLDSQLLILQPLQVACRLESQVLCLLCSLLPNLLDVQLLNLQ